MKTNKRYISFIFLLLFTSLKGFAQSGLPEFPGKVSVLGQLLGPELLGISTNVYVSNRLAITTGIGLNANLHAGLNYYLFDRSLSRTTFYVGFQIITVKEYDEFNSEETEQLAGIYFPIGMEFISPKGFTLQVEAGPNILNGNGEQANTGPFQIAFRIGKTVFPERMKSKDKKQNKDLSNQFLIRKLLGLE